MASRKKTSKSSKPEKSEVTIKRTVTTPDGETIQIGVSPLFREFEKHCQWLNRKGICPPPEVFAWMERHATQYRIGDGPWTPVILDPTDPLPA